MDMFENASTDKLKCWGFVRARVVAEIDSRPVHGRPSQR